jgi:hypothetical protein
MLFRYNPCTDLLQLSFLGRTSAVQDCHVVITTVTLTILVLLTVVVCRPDLLWYLRSFMVNASLTDGYHNLLTFNAILIAGTYYCMFTSSLLNVLAAHETYIRRLMVMTHCSRSKNISCVSLLH